MADEQKRKDIWDKLAAVTPLLLGILIAGVGAVFTNIYNFRQLQLNQVAALDKLRPLLTAQNPQDREFAYSSFVALGYEGLAIRLIEVQRDETGRKVLTQLAITGPIETREKASAAIQVLDEAKKLVNTFEFGRPEGDEKYLKEHPEAIASFVQGQKWAEATAHELGISSKLGVAILYDTATNIGAGRAGRIKESVSILVPPPLDTREKEKAWLAEYLDKRDEAMKQGSAGKFYPGIAKRIAVLRNLLNASDWDLRTVEQSNQLSDTSKVPAEVTPQPAAKLIKGVEDVRGTVMRILADEFAVDAAKLNDSATLKHLGLDDLDIVQMANMIQEVYKIEISGDVQKQLKTVGDWISYVTANKTKMP